MRTWRAGWVKSVAIGFYPCGVWVPIRPIRLVCVPTWRESLQEQVEVQVFIGTICKWISAMLDCSSREVTVKYMYIEEELYGLLWDKSNQLRRPPRHFIWIYSAWTQSKASSLLSHVYYSYPLKAHYFTAGCVRGGPRLWTLCRGCINQTSHSGEGSTHWHSTAHSTHEDKRENTQPKLLL